MNTSETNLQSTEDPELKDTGFDHMFDQHIMENLWEAKCTKAWRFDGHSSYIGSLLTNLESWFTNITLQRTQLFYSFELHLWATGRCPNIPPIYSNTGLQIDLILSSRLVNTGGKFAISKSVIAATVREESSEPSSDPIIIVFESEEMHIAWQMNTNRPIQPESDWSVHSLIPSRL